MSITLANVGTGISGKTLLAAENDNTVTGLLTYDRDPLAPFAVSANSAKVTNLDADKLDGVEGAAYYQIGATITGDLLFTDATYDIGKSGATRPRDIFASRNVAIGGTLGVTGLSTLAAVTGTSFKVGYVCLDPIVATLTDGATPALDASLGNVFYLSAAGDRTIAVPSNPTSGQKIVIRHYASGGARTLALNTGAGGFRYGSDITALSQTASGKMDYIGAIYNSVASFWDVVAYVKGY